MKSLFFRAALSIGCAFLPISPAVAAAAQAPQPLPAEHQAALRNAVEVFNSVLQVLDRRVDATPGCRALIDELYSCLDAIPLNSQKQHVLHFFKAISSALQGKAKTPQLVRDTVRQCATGLGIPTQFISIAERLALNEQDELAEKHAAWRLSCTCELPLLKQCCGMEPRGPSYPATIPPGAVPGLVLFQIQKIDQILWYIEEQQLKDQLTACRGQLARVCGFLGGVASILQTGNPQIIAALQRMYPTESQK
ncbi:MAG: hypothetical protein LBF84_01295 [Holosporales bacterium]|jgi:hypothetical protein|nr:hypothetical protein [Holosporales bacterium]